MPPTKNPKRPEKTPTILITGGTGTIGSQFVSHFLEKGWRVIFTSHTAAKITKLYAKYKKPHQDQQLIGHEIDLEAADSALQLIKFLKENKIFPHVLINNARNLDHLKQDQKMLSREKWLGEFLLDVVVAYELSLNLATQKKSQLKSIINISSMYGLVSANPHLYPPPMVPAPLNYGVCKAGLIHLTKQLAVMLAPQNIRVNAISYGGVEGSVNQQFKKRYAKLSPMGRMLHPQETVAAADFLASEQSLAITGHNLIADGGWTIW